MVSSIGRRVKAITYFQTWKKVDKDYIHTVLLEAGYLVIAAAIIVLCSLLLNSLIQQTTTMTPAFEELYTYIGTQGALPDVDSELGQSIIGSTESVKGFLVKSLAITLLCVILLILNSCFFKSVIWARVHNTKWNKKYLIKFAKLNSLWLLAWLAIFIITVMVFLTQIAAYLLLIEFVLFIYVTNTWRALFNTKKKNWLIVKTTCKKAFTNMHKALLPVAAIIGTFYLYLILIYFLLILPESIYTVLFFLGIIFLICFSRSYFNEIVKGFK